MITTVPEGKLLYGDWRHRTGSKTDAHLYYTKHAEDRPICGKRIKRGLTVVVTRGRPCTECLVNAITGRDYSR